MSNSTQLDPTITIPAAVIGSIGTISGLASVFVITSIILFRYYHSKPNRLILALCTADIFQSWATISSFYWTGNVIANGNTCTFQAFFFQFGDLSSSFWAAAICVYSVLFGIFNKDYRYFEVFAHIICWGIPMLFSFIGFAVPKAGEPFFYGNSGAWCWIDPYYPVERIVFHYLYIWLIMIFLAIAYGFMAYRLNAIVRNSQTLEKDTNHRRLKKITKKLAGYPIAYFCIFSPLALERTLSVCGVVVPYDYLIFSMCVFAMNGLSNATIYCYTRNIFQRYKKFVVGERIFSESSGTHGKSDRISADDTRDGRTESLKSITVSDEVTALDEKKSDPVFDDENSNKDEEESVTLSVEVK